MKKKSEPCYLNDFFDMHGHRVAYKRFINGLNTKLSTPVSAEEKIVRLDFRTDFGYGELTELYFVIAEALAVDRFLRRGYTRNMLFRWLCSAEHSNLRKNWPTVERAVNECAALLFNSH